MLVPIHDQCSLRSPSGVDPSERPTSPLVCASWASHFATWHLTKLPWNAVDGEHGRNPPRFNEAKLQVLHGLMVHYVKVHCFFFLPLRSMMAHPCLERQPVCRRPTELPTRKICHAPRAAIMSSVPNTTTLTPLPKITPPSTRAAWLRIRTHLPAHIPDRQVGTDT